MIVVALIPIENDIFVGRILGNLFNFVDFVLKPLFYLNGDINFRNRVLEQGLWRALKKELFQSQVSQRWVADPALCNELWNTLRLHDFTGFLMPLQQLVVSEAWAIAHGILQQLACLKTRHGLGVVDLTGAIKHAFE